MFILAAGRGAIPKTTVEYDRARKSQILKAAYARFARDGFGGSRMTDIADDVGLSVGALYRYFSGKKELIREVVTAIQDTERALAGIPEDAADLLLALQGAVSRMIEVLDEPWAEGAMRLSARVPGEALDDPVLAEHVRSTNRVLREHIEGLLDRAAAAGQIRAGVEPKSVSAVLVSTVRGAAFQRLVEPGLDLGAYAAAVRTLLEGCRA